MTRPTGSARQVHIQERMKAGEYLTGLLYRGGVGKRIPRHERTPDAASQQHAVREAAARVEGLEKILARYR